MLPRQLPDRFLDLALFVELCITIASDVNKLISGNRKTDRERAFSIFWPFLAILRVGATARKVPSRADRLTPILSIASYTLLVGRFSARMTNNQN
jgi:hypothetical protein